MMIASHLAGEEFELPSIRKIQEMLASIGALSADKVGSECWIEPPEVAALMRRKYGVAMEESVHNITSVEGYNAVIALLRSHFSTKNPSPVMLDDSLCAYIVAGIATFVDGSVHLLLLDPHAKTPVTEEGFLAGCVCIKHLFQVYLLDGLCLECAPFFISPHRFAFHYSALKWCSCCNSPHTHKSVHHVSYKPFPIH